MPGFVERLKDDLDKASPPGASTMSSVIPHPTSHEPGYNAQRKHAPWIGGSMLASLSPFKQVNLCTFLNRCHHQRELWGVGHGVQ